jgi:plasmid stabilization system protein ParE
VARVVYTPNALANLERAVSSLAEIAPDAVEAAVEVIRSGIEMLEHHPLIGRIVADDLRELVISFGRSGYLALYCFVPVRDEIWILALRHQRELDYP